MKSNLNNISASGLKAQKYDFDDPIQRGEDQWDSLQKTKLIDSLLREIPVDAARAIKSEINSDGQLVKHKGGGVIVDGKQRLTTIIAYLNDEFALDVKYLLSSENESASTFKDGDDVEYSLYDLVYDVNLEKENKRVEKAQQKENDRVEAVNKKHEGEEGYTPEVAKVIERREVESKLVGKKFSELSAGLQVKLSSVQVPVYSLSEVTPWEKVELFKRQNNGKPLTNAQMNNAEYSKETYKAIKEISSVRGATYTWEVDSKNRAGEVKRDKKGNIVKLKKKKEYGNIWHRQLSNTLLKSGEERQIVLQTLMLIDNFNDGNFGFSNDDTKRFIAKFNGLSDEERRTLVDKAKVAALTFNTALDENTAKISNLKKTSVPMLVAGMDLAMAAGVDVKQYVANVKAFFDRYKNDDEDIVAFRDTVGAASATPENVKYRWEVFKNFAR